ncbi:hypothetical protein ECG_07591 [Echinococcus granulosus]|nr:hypothetical protein ECG_07591 [Echinococcus granulosus]
MITPEHATHRSTRVCRGLGGGGGDETVSAREVLKSKADGQIMKPTCQYKSVNESDSTSTTAPKVQMTIKRVQARGVTDMQEAGAGSTCPATFTIDVQFNNDLSSA